MKASNVPQHNNVKGYGFEMEKDKVLLSRKRCLLNLRITCMDIKKNNLSIGRLGWILGMNIKKNNLRTGRLGWILGRVRKGALASQEG